MTKKEVIIIFGAHSDDFVIGAGGTIAKYMKEKKKVLSIVFSYGEKSHPWMKEKIVQKMRVKEADEASKVLGCNTFFYPLREMHFKEDYQKHKIEDKLLKIINKEKPTKIFTHSSEDPHPDHKVVYSATQELFKKINFKPEECVFLDDSEKNILQPKEMGMATIHYKNKEQLIEEFRKLGIEV